MVLNENESETLFVWCHRTEAVVFKERLFFQQAAVWLLLDNLVSNVCLSNVETSSIVHNSLRKKHYQDLSCDFVLVTSYSSSKVFLWKNACFSNKV